MKQIKILMICMGVLLAVQHTFAQSPRTDDPNNRPTDRDARLAQKRKEMDRINGRDQNGMIIGRSNPGFSRPPRIKPDGKTYTKEELEKIKALLAPNPEDLTKYKDFLKRSGTGLFRLFPNFHCETKAVVRVDGNCANFISEGWTYSFRTKDHSGLDFFDLRFLNGDLIADGFLSQEILVPLGDVQLENVSLTSTGIKFLNDFKPEIQSQEAKKQFAQIANVIEADGFKYAKRVKVVENIAYAMRIVAYRSQDNLASRLGSAISRDNRRYLMLNNFDKRKDLTLVFRIIRKDSDGSISILWKELKRQDAPKLIFQKTEKISDIKEN